MRVSELTSFEPMEISINEVLDWAFATAADEGWKPERLYVSERVAEMARQELGEPWKEERGVSVYSHPLRNLKLVCRGGNVVMHHE